MNLKKLQITNFRCFESLSIDLDEQLTVLVAKNGQGKSSVLDAIRIGLWSFVSGFDLARTLYNDPANAISIDDVRMLKMRDGQMARQLPCKITLTPNSLPSFGDAIKLPWTRARNSEAKGSKTKDEKGVEVIKCSVISTQDKIRNPESSDVNLPVIGYYGTGRLWSQKRLTEGKKTKGNQNTDFYMRLFAYRDCLDPASSYKYFAEWFTWIFESYREDQIKQAEKGLPTEIDSISKNAVQVVQQAIDSVLHNTGWHTLEYSVSHEKSLVLNHDQNGMLKVGLLSDGIRGVLAMVGDIAYRCIKLNPHLGGQAAKETNGIVMIDEVDMHLHPAWQQTILVDLIKAFPKIQFIVTTHSPQVLTTVKPQCIRLLSENGEVLIPSINIYGEESKVALEDIMQVSSRPYTKDSDLLQVYLQRINQGDIDSKEVKQLRQALEKAFGSEYSKLKLADMVISKWKAKRGIV